jgi:hypothetical protein
MCLFVWFWKGGVHGCFSQIFEIKNLEFLSKELAKLSWLNTFKKKTTFTKK